jgi:hypothetical protein
MYKCCHKEARALHNSDNAQHAGNNIYGFTSQVAYPGTFSLSHTVTTTEDARHENQTEEPSSTDGGAIDVYTAGRKYGQQSSEEGYATSIIRTRYFSTYEEIDTEYEYSHTLHVA